MINPATRPSNELNDFTRWFSMMTEGWPNRPGEFWVRLRNGTLVRPVFKAAEDEYCEDAFYAEDYKYCWNLDGTSVTRSDYDMMEIVSND